MFAGIGGFDYTFERLGCATQWYSEVEPYAVEVLKRHFPQARNVGDVTKWDPDPVTDAVDILVGGFPCQPVSVAGKGRAQADARWLWPQFARIIGILRPKYVLAENVSGLRAKGLTDVLRDLAALGYDAEWHSIPASAVGAPHQRDRIWIVAYPSILGYGSTDSRGSPSPQSENERWVTENHHCLERDGGSGGARLVADALGLGWGSLEPDLQTGESYTTRSGVVIGVDWAQGPDWAGSREVVADTDHIGLERPKLLGEANSIERLLANSSSAGTVSDPSSTGQLRTVELAHDCRCERGRKCTAHADQTDQVSGPVSDTNGDGRTGSRVHLRQGGPQQASPDATGRGPSVSDTEELGVEGLWPTRFVFPRIDVAQALLVRYGTTCRAAYWPAEPNLGDLANGLPAAMVALLDDGSCDGTTKGIEAALRVRSSRDGDPAPETESEEDILDLIPIPRVARDIPRRVDKLKALGNAIVPPVAEFVGRFILVHYQRNYLGRSLLDIAYSNA